MHENKQVRHLHIVFAYTYLEVQRELNKNMRHVSKSSQSLFWQEAKTKMTQIIMHKNHCLRVTNPNFRTLYP